MISYIDILKFEYGSRKRQNRAYSERAFARDLGVSASFLKALFQEKKHLSEARAKLVAKKLKISQNEQQEFLRVFYRTVASASKKKEGKAILKKDDISALSEWCCFVIVELVKIKQGVTSQEISAVIGISPLKTKNTLKLLVEKNMLVVKEGRFFSHLGAYEVPSMPSEAIRGYHRQMLTLAIKSLEAQTFENRDFRGLTLAIEKSRIGEAKKFLDKCVSEFERRFSAKEADAIYQLHTSFFKLNKKDF
ncbi:hypothetical protein AZI86_12555 [Bdellovibrio bacteriovorus]|uniref:DUF4423 domain-containing protein n=1 Tax=Bdellovibrio bacteriovorus TaxID=959 RepID=A0A150WJA1_BDEBC|nr:TIGR02147 family protein [Bdellovibrio bacteriovorus]KYG63655.1 hypothetical protein AZI86_12555 [Bdellovibrio bacteriovorus]